MMCVWNLYLLSYLGLTISTLYSSGYCSDMALATIMLRLRYASPLHQNLFLSDRKPRSSASFPSWPKTNTGDEATTKTCLIFDPNRLFSFIQKVSHLRHLMRFQKSLLGNITSTMADQTPYDMWGRGFLIVPCVENICLVPATAQWRILAEIFILRWNQPIKSYYTQSPKFTFI